MLFRAILYLTNSSGNFYLCLGQFSAHENIKILSSNCDKLMPQSVHRAQNCGAQTLSLTVHYGGEKLGKEWSDFDHQQT